MLFTCHDRTFVATVADDIVEVKDGAARRFGDGYDAYVWRLEQEAAASEPASSGGKGGSGDDAKTQRRERQEQLDKAKKRLKRVEQLVATLDTEKKQLTAKLNIPDQYDIKAGERLRW